MKALTRHAPGGIRELLSISIPLIITAFSGNLLVVIDRIMLSYHSIDAMNAVAGVGIVFAAFYFPGTAIAGMTEVFVGQYNGAEQYHKISSPVWQMIWFSLWSVVIYLPLAFMGEHFFLSEAFVEEGLSYYQMLVCGCPLFLIHSAVSGFFIGTGRTKLVTYVVFVGTILNICLNYWFIFGGLGVPELGALGAGIASIIAECIQLLILLYAFLNKHNHTIYKTRLVSLDFDLMWEELKVGVPNAVGHTFEIAGWAFLTNFRANFGMDYIVVMTITSTAYIFFTFFTDGIHKGVTAIASNFIGAKNYVGIEKLKSSAYKVQISAAIILFFPMVGFNDLTIGSIMDISNFSEAAIYGIKLAMLGNFLFMAIDGFFWIYAGLLTAGGDTKALMVISGTAVWIACVLPAVIWLSFFPSESYTVSLYAYPVYGVIVTALLYFRVRSGKWMKLHVAHSEA
ncbi:MAG: MATE family efflux transporter [Candidatus Paracaedibacteraceae bacterium]|nr:MATE family efflux transporter [Candidatus Paracaedibacteraceae bacterium]